ncbi:MAG: SDR family oxidoreductase [Microbacterium sp.]|uniref:SDR family NAD(P)-dependent oxidoreductase n=1 Tax=Microbacterium sp. TaxID=51671 RepID=UPI0039E24AB1
MTEKHVAVVTGATGGIGAAICRRLHADGYAIVAHYRGDHDAAQALASSLGADCHLVSADLSTMSGVNRVLASVNDVLERHDGYVLRALVNNAAKLLGPSFFDATADQFDEYVSINMRAPFFLAQGLTRSMLPGGSVVNISSASTHFSSPGDIVYAMSKAGVESLTRNMAEAIAPRGLRVNTVIPGFTDNGHPAFRDPEVRRYMSSFSVLGDVATPETVAHAVAFLISDDANRTTGTTVDVSGGSTLGARGDRAAGVGSLLRHDA